MVLGEPLEPKIVDEHKMPPGLDAGIRRSLCACFPADVAVFSETRKWHGSGPSFSVVIEDKGEVVAHVGVVDRVVRFGSRPARAAGIQNVFVLPSHRGRNLADAVMRAAQEEARARGFDGGLLFCVPKLEKVYARMGWHVIANDVVRVDDDGLEKPIPGKNIGMFFPLRWTQAPPDMIHLGGNDW
jgi:GNAT superfamily N-acetyltransferase